MLALTAVAIGTPPERSPPNRPRPGGTLSRLWPWSAIKEETQQPPPTETAPANIPTQTQVKPADPRDLFSQLWQPPNQTKAAGPVTTGHEQSSPAAKPGAASAPLLKQPAFFAPNGEPIAAAREADNSLPAESNAANAARSSANQRQTVAAFQSPALTTTAIAAPPAASQQSGHAPMTRAMTPTASTNRLDATELSNIAAGLLRQVSPTTAAKPAADAPQAPALIRSDPSLPHGSVPVPNAAPLAAAEQLQAATADLWRPLTMRQDAAPMAVPSRPPVVSAAPSSTNTADSGLGSFLLQPFQLTNAPPTQQPAGAGEPVATNTRQDDLARRIRSSALVQQLSLSTGNTTAIFTDPLGQVAFQTEHAVWDQGWTAGGGKDGSAIADAELVAFLDDVLPEPEDLEVDTDDELAPAPATNGGQANQGENEEDSLAEAEQVGEEPEDTSLQFLRTQTVLLKPGESQFDVGINYLLTENDFPVLLTDDMGTIIGVDEVRFRVRELTVPLEYRLGLHERVQGFVGVPIGWSNTQVSLDALEAFENDGGIGDVNFGLTMQLVDASANNPYMIATIAATAPTGGDPFRGIAGLAPSAPSLGQGFWSISGSLLFIQPYDPVVVFYGLGTEHFFSRQFRGFEIEPGAQYNYLFGVGFAVNERITLSTRFLGAYVEEIKVDGERRFGTNAEPMSLRLSATISKPCDRLVEPFVEFGLTDDAISSFIGITWTY